MNIIYIGYTFIKCPSQYLSTLYSFLLSFNYWDHNLYNTYLNIFIYNVFNGLMERRTKYDHINKMP